MDQKIQEIILKVLEGRASVQDSNELLDWIQISEENRKELEHIEGIWNAIAVLANHEKFEAQKGYHDFITGLNDKRLNLPETKQKRKIYPFLQIAAGILLVAGLAFVIGFNSNRKEEKISFFELTTPKGSHTQLTLIDGTKIWLNAESKIRYPNKFEGKTRTIYLEGEAYFDVQTDSLKPFVVQTSAIKVKAFGTSFNVKAYPNEGSIETTLIKGSVTVEDNKANSSFSSVKLLPNQRVTFVKTTGKLLLNEQEKSILKKKVPELKLAERKEENIIVTERVKTEIYTSWIDNQLLFDNETFESIAFKLERRYGATIIFHDEKMKAYKFSGNFPEISIERALKALQFASPFEYKIKQDTIFID